MLEFVQSVRDRKDGKDGKGIDTADKEENIRQWTRNGPGKGGGYSATLDGAYNIKAAASGQAPLRHGQGHTSMNDRKKRGSTLKAAEVSELVSHHLQPPPLLPQEKKLPRIGGGISRNEEITKDTFLNHPEG